MSASFPATLMRGGTSKGLFINAEDLPADEHLRNKVLLAAMGSPDRRQIDGMGGAHPLTSKVALLSRPTRSDADIDYLFLQVSVDQAEVSAAQNCGNMLAGVGPWAIRQGWVKPTSTNTTVRIHMLNSGGMAKANVPTDCGEVSEEGRTSICGVPGNAAPISLEFLEIAGASTGQLFPTGQKVDRVCGIDVTCIDNGMPVILLRATDVDISGTETPSQLEANPDLKHVLENIRLAMGPRMNLGDVRHSTVPKLTLLSAPQDIGLVMTRTFIPHRVHEAIGVLGAISVATGCVIAGTVAADLVSINGSDDRSGQYRIEHASGYVEVELDVIGEDVRRAALIRTARLLMAGDVYVPDYAWPSTRRDKPPTVESLRT